MSSDQTIQQVFNTEHYAPFVRFCQERGLVRMADLVRCPFDELAAAPDIGAGLALRIKSMYALYRRNHPEEFAPKKRGMDLTSPLAVRVERYFKANGERLLELSEITRAVTARRAEVVQVLEKAPWCQTVDATHFYLKK